MQRLHANIDLSMALAFRRNPQDPSNNTYVARITLCKGVPMYGFHVGWRFFLKIYMLNPAYMQRLGDLLRNGLIMGKSMQPYEVHIPYLLQFMADYGLYGCGWVECETVRFRAPVPDGENGGRMWNESTIPTHLISSSEDRPRLSHCALEIDLFSHHILNRRAIKPRLLHHDFVERKNLPSLDERLVHSMAELWLDDKRRREKMGKSEPDASMDGSLSRNDEEIKRKGPWIHETELREKLEETIQAERAKSDAHALNFDTFVRPAKFQSLVQTALESVTDMFPAEIPSQKEAYVGTVTSSGHLRENRNEFPSAEINEAQILELLNDLATEPEKPEASLHDEYFSEMSSEADSEIDFDGDLLGRGQDLGESEVEEGAFPYIDVQDFSDDADIDLGLGSRGLKFKRENGVDSDGDSPFKPLRLRGGASSSGRKKRRLNEYEYGTRQMKLKNTLPESQQNIRQYRKSEERTSSVSSSPTDSKLLERIRVIRGDDSQRPTRKSSEMIWSNQPPSTTDLLSSLQRHGIPRVVPRDAFYGRDEDVPSTSREYGGRKFKLVSGSLRYLDRFNTGISTNLFEHSGDDRTRSRIWQFENRPPLVKDLLEFRISDIGPGISFPFISDRRTPSVPGI